MTTPATTPPAATPAKVLLAIPSFLLNVVRGALIGLAELIPGISGGTVALITGVYERLITSASHVITAARVAVSGPDRRRNAARELRQVDVALILPVLLGMVAMVLTLAGIVESMVSANPELSRGLFFGLVAASIVVPLQQIPRLRRSTTARIGGVTVFFASAILAFALVGLAGGAVAVDPSLVIVFFAAAIAVCALVVPGVSGSFFLLAIGLYSPTLLAVDERNLAYLAVFAAGALLGLVTIVQAMRRLLERHRRLTLLAMSGLMLGSLRALWPWQELAPGETHGVGSPVAPYDPVAGPIVLALLGAAAVFVLLLVENALTRRSLDAEHGSETPQKPRL
ncbi:putative membrane protein [Microbacterium sp. SLBN-154]|uniref:DUF368 domain-containing protein n=1 Tax=Microbacterium sp. SLBN-154 TaxID=2768458 RepID=UPI001152D1F7|nr:DUF368 domain-containing protein [Microbacterium sp. SLBN-154]TQK20518.1 putative membrane protein [Microbacterium sp. SLBN-154]